MKTKGAAGIKTKWNILSKMKVTVINKEQCTTYYSILKRNFQRNIYTHCFILKALLLTLNMFYCSVSIVNFQQVNVDWESATLLTSVIENEVL